MDGISLWPCDDPATRPSPPLVDRDPASFLSLLALKCQHAKDGWGKSEAAGQVEQELTPLLLLPLICIIIIMERKKSVVVHSGCYNKIPEMIKTYS